MNALIGAETGLATSTVLCVLKDENHLRQARDRAAQNIQAGKYGLKERHQRMIDRWPLARYFHQPKQTQFIQYRYRPKWRALRVGKRFDLQPLILGHARKTVAIEQHEMARRMVAAPRAMAEYFCIQRVVIGRFDQQETVRRQQRSRFCQHLVGAPDVLDQIEHEDEVVFFFALELLDGAEKVAMSRTLRGIFGAGVDIDDLRCRHPRLDRFHGIEQPAGPSADVQGGELLSRNLPRDGAKHPAVEGLLYFLDEASRAGGSEGIVILRVNRIEPVVQHRRYEQDGAIVAAVVVELLRGR